MKPIIAQLSSVFSSSVSADSSRYLRDMLQPKKGQDLVIALASGDFAIVSRIFLKCFESF